MAFLAKACLESMLLANRLSGDPRIANTEKSMPTRR